MRTGHLTAEKRDQMQNCSAASPWGIIPGTIIDAFDGNSKDGQIEDTKQGATGDCWLLSGISAKLH